MSEILNDRYEENRDVSLSAFDQYLCVVRWAEAQPLSGEEQYKYFQRLVRARRDPANGWLASLAKDACDVLVEKYQPIVYCLVRGYARCCRGMEILDLVQEANIGLLRGLRTFDLDFDLSSFRAWLVGCARMSLRKVYWDQCGFVRFPWRVQSQLLRLVDVEREYHQMLGRDPQSFELCQALGLSAGQLQELFSYRRLFYAESLQGLSDRYDGAEDRRGFVSLYCPSSEETSRTDTLAARVEQALAQLSPQRRRVMSLRYGLCGEVSHADWAEVSAVMGIKWNTVQSVSYHARNRLRVLLAPLYEDRGVSA